MVRKQRTWFRGAKYHITSRGVRKSLLFYDNEDRYEYLLMLNKTKHKYPFILHTYCLMDNHIHLQMETLETPPGLIMKHLHSKYAKYFNQKHEFTGHLFEKRYGSELIDSSDYELDVSRYIHLNPLKAKMVENLADYQWSSIHNYLTDATNSPHVYTNQILSYFPPPKLENYLRFLHSPQVELSESKSIDIKDFL